jgi:L-lysine exporter family protein LysE/ArgO
MPECCNPPMLQIFMQGFLLQASLILALGAQNIFILNSGLRRERHLFAALISSICDTFLVFIGVLGAATFFVQYPLLQKVLGILAVGFLAYYGALKIREFKNGITLPIDRPSATSYNQTLLASLGFSLLNPHVYLDTVVLIGGFSSKFSSHLDRFYFGAGASVFSTIWFFALASLASYARLLLKSDAAMRKVSLISGIILIVLSLKLGFELFGR